MLPTPWKDSSNRHLSSVLEADQTLGKIKASFDFEGNLTPVQHFIAGTKSFIGCINKEKRSFLIYCRHGSQGTPFFARVADGIVQASGKQSVINYKFKLRLWDRIFLCIGIAVLFCFSSLSFFYLLIEPKGDSILCTTLTTGLLLLAWFSPQIAQKFYQDDERKIAELLRSIAEGKFDES